MRFPLLLRPHPSHAGQPFAGSLEPRSRRTDRLRTSPRGRPSRASATKRAVAPCGKTQAVQLGQFAAPRGRQGSPWRTSRPLRSRRRGFPTCHAEGPRIDPWRIAFGSGPPLLEPGVYRIRTRRSAIPSGQSRARHIGPPSACSRCARWPDRLRGSLAGSWPPSRSRPAAGSRGPKPRSLAARCARRSSWTRSAVPPRADPFRMSPLPFRATSRRPETPALPSRPAALRPSASGGSPTDQNPLPEVSAPRR
eukprot:scaffold7102_cov247-Pinguiococcus_pyrenoidosus.AAC.3